MTLPLPTPLSGNILGTPGSSHDPSAATVCLQDTFHDDLRVPRYTEKGSEVTKRPHLHQTKLTGEHFAVGLLRAFNVLVDAGRLPQELEYTALSPA